MHTTNAEAISAPAVAVAKLRLPLAAIGAIALGALLVFAAGFAGGAVHDDAHDTRHSHALPCH